MNSITKFAVKYPVSVLMLTLAVCLLGTIKCGTVIGETISMTMFTG